jgi:hypothetical protein
VPPDRLACLVYGVGWANAGFIGFKFGAGAYSQLLYGVSVQGCINGSFDFTAGDGSNSQVQAWVYNNVNTTLYTGTPSDGFLWDLTGAVGANGDHPSLWLPPNQPIQLNSERRSSGSRAIEDDFLSAGTATGTIGELGWTPTIGAGGIVSSQAGIINHPGILRMTTGATSGTTCAIMQGASPMMTSDKEHSHYFVFRLNQVDANTQARVGLVASTADPATDGVYLERLNGDTNWFLVVRNGGTQTRTNTTVAATTGWLRVSLKWAFVSGLRWRCSINEAADIDSGLTNVPAAGTALSPMFQIINSAASAKTMDVDYYSGRFHNLSRA